jgi:hypothetical protein
LRPDLHKEIEDCSARDAHKGFVSGVRA